LIFATGGFFAFAVSVILFLLCEDRRDCLSS
jgi:hypothetical protein